MAKLKDGAIPALLDLLSDESAATVPVALAAIEAGGATAREASEISGISEHTSRQHLEGLADEGLVNATDAAGRGQGRDPVVFEPAGALLEAARGDEASPDKDDVAASLAALHYSRGLSSATAIMVANGVDGLTSIQAGKLLADLEDLGAVKRTKEVSSATRFRLIGAGEYTQYNAGYKTVEKSNGEG